MPTRRNVIVGGSTAAIAAGAGFVAWTQLGSHAGDDFPLSLSEEDWRARLTETQFAVMRRGKTEARFSSPLNEEGRAGVYACAGCAEPVYASGTKFESESGWPSFTAALEGQVGTRPDPSLGGMLTEVHCANCGSHLGHIFEDGPPPTGERHCINGVALEFAAA